MGQEDASSGCHGGSRGRSSPAGATSGTAATTGCSSCSTPGANQLHQRHDQAREGIIVYATDTLKRGSRKACRAVNKHFVTGRRRMLVIDKQ